MWSQKGEHQQEGGGDKEAGIASSGPAGSLLSTRVHIRKDKESQSVIVGTLLKGLFKQDYTSTDWTSRRGGSTVTEQRSGSSAGLELLLHAESSTSDC